MKRLIKTAIIITACVGLRAGVWSRNGTGKTKNAVSAELPAVSAPKNALPIEGTAPQAATSAEKEETEVSTTPVASETVDASLVAEGILQSATATEATPTTATFSDDPYRTDVYPENLYSEKLLYDAEGNLLDKTITYPTTFGPDSIWIDGRAYYDIPDFGLVEWSGPGERTEDYTMYESGNKVGIMGGEAETTAIAAPSNPPEEPPKFTGEVIDQTINAVPKKASTPPNYKPSTTAPGDSDARIIP